MLGELLNVSIELPDGGNVNLLEVEFFAELEDAMNGLILDGVALFVPTLGVPYPLWLDIFEPIPCFFPVLGLKISAVFNLIVLFKGGF